MYAPPIAAAADTVTGSSAASEPTAELSALLTSVGGTVAADALSAAFSGISAQSTADLAAFAPQSMLSSREGPPAER